MSSSHTLSHAFFQCILMGFNVRLAGNHLYGKWLLTLLSLVMSLVVSCFMLSLFPQDVLDEIWDRTESVPEDFSYLLLNPRKPKPITFPLL